ncbi:uncharacterized protein LOC113746034 [Larimichthys crocea]|uniref:uncharacterized protein LOC113746034 n=1 Tax=Larimichthys crocea TaxID=215358 RepID=UPI000F5E01F8|nr:uncharacterized protein LOC113746034 [Larimichthys crocea]
MDETLALNASDSDLLDEISNTPEVPETSPSPVIPAGQPPRPRSVVQIRRRLRSSISDSSNAIGPSPPHRPRGRTRLRRPSDTGDSRRSSPTRSRRASDRRSRPEATSPGQHAVRPPARGIADWTVASLKRSLTHHNIPFHYSDRKATLFRRLRHFLHNSTSRTPLPGRRRHDDDVTPPSSARPSHPALTQGQVVSNRTLSVPASHSSSTVPQASLFSPPPPAGSCPLPLYPPLPSNHSLATATPPARPTASPRPSPVSSALRQQILSGNYVDLAQLIHPSTHNPHIPRELQTALGTFQLKQPLTTHSKELTAPEFTLAFSLYRDVICSAFPDRRSELDDYLSLIIDLALRFGGNGFYSYHILFASQAAERLHQFNQGTHWGTLDIELYCRTFAARPSLHCDQCGAPSHPATTCSITTQLPHSSAPQKRNQAVSRNLPPAAPPPSITPKPATPLPASLGPAPKGVDKRGRPILYQGGRMLCNNFNDLGCSTSSCRFLHTCSFCGGAHARVTCPHNPTKHGPCKYLNTPINIHALSSALINHPDRQFVNYLIQGFTHGFHPGLYVTPDSSFSCHNLQSAISDPDTVDRLLAKEVTETFMIGPFSSPPFPSFRISPIGIATRKYSGKKRLIIDLSSPHGSTVPSINSLIPSPDFSMQYSTINHAISLIRAAGRGAWLAKADITSAFKVLPIHPDYWHLFGVLWKGAFYFAVRLTFGCKSSPKIFDSLSEALCWILINNHKLPYVIHLLDDFLTVTPPSLPPSHGLTTMVSVFTDLGVPLSAEKTEGPSTSLEFLGITLDSISLQASLPIEKIHRTSLRISNFLLAHRCTKRQLLSLLGHLNYAIRIIPQGRSFLSHLLSIATSTPNLHDHITLNEASKMELKLWHHFLSSWNGISFFYDDHVTKPEDIQLFTDAAPSAGFGGFYSGKWFAAAWPHEFPPLPHSSTIHEIYPVIVAAILWGHEWSKKTIAIYSDNSAAVDIINKGRSHSLDIMQFIRRLTLVSAQHQFIIRASHIPGHKNAIADSLSCFSLQKFKLLAPDSDPLPTPIPPYSATIFN